MSTSAPLYAARSLAGRVAALAMRMGARIDPMTYWDTDTPAPPSAWTLNVERGRGPFIATYVSFYFGASAQDALVTIYRGGTPLQDGDGFPAELMSGTSEPGIQAPIVLFEEDLKFVFAPFFGGAVAPDIYVSGFHTDDAFARYVARTLGEHRGIVLNAESAGDTTPTIRATRAIDATLVQVAWRGSAEPTGFVLRRNTLEVFNDQGDAAPISAFERLAGIDAEAFSHPVEENDTYVLRTVWGVAGQAIVSLIGSSSYPEHF